MLCAVIVVIAALVGLSKSVVAGAWAAVGALLASIFMAATVWRLAAVAQEWRRELRSSRAEAASLQKELAYVRADAAAVEDAVSQGVILCGADGVIKSANAAAKELFKFPQPVGRTVLAMSLSYELHSLVVRRMLTEEAHVVNEISLSYPVARTVIARTFRVDETPTLVLLTLEDVTQLRRLQTVRSDFVANVSHELRTPLSAIRAMAETILDDENLSPETKKKYLSKIISEVDQLTAISNDLLSLASAESSVPEQTEIDLAEVLAYCLQHIERQSVVNGLELKTNIADKLLVTANRNQLIQVFSNLLSNAMRYTPKGFVELTARREEDEVIVEVKDSGIGISSEHVSRIFERFYRVDKARSRDTGGTGLGLSIVRHIIESLGGKIEVESVLNVGSTFRVRLPAAESSLASV